MKFLMYALSQWVALSEREANHDRLVLVAILSQFHRLMIRLNVTYKFLPRSKISRCPVLRIVNASLALERKKESAIKAWANLRIAHLHLSCVSVLVSVSGVRA